MPSHFDDSMPYYNDSMSVCYGGIPLCNNGIELCNNGIQLCNNGMPHCNAGMPCHTAMAAHVSILSIFKTVWFCNIQSMIHNRNSITREILTQNFNKLTFGLDGCINVNINDCVVVLFLPWSWVKWTRFTSELCWDSMIMASSVRCLSYWGYLHMKTSVIHICNWLATPY